MRCCAAGPWPHSALTTLLLTGRSRRVSPRRAAAGPAGSGRPAPRRCLCSGFASPPGGTAPPPRPRAAAGCAPHSRCSVPPVSAGAGLSQHLPVPRLRRLPEDAPQAARGWRPARPRPGTATAPPGTAGAAGARAEGARGWWVRPERECRRAREPGLAQSRWIA